MYKNLKAFRESIGITQKDFAASLGIGLTTYNGYETGARDPKSDFWIAVAQKYGVTIDYLMGYSNDPHKTGVTEKTAPAYTAEALSIAKKYDALDEWGRDAVKGLMNIEYTRCTAPEPEAEQDDNCIYLPLSEQPASAGTGTYLGPEAFTPIKVVANDKTRRADFCVRVQGDSMEPIYFDGDIVMISKERPGYNGIGLVTLDGCGYIKRLGMGVLESENKKYAPIPLDESVVVNGRAVGILHPDWIIK